MVQPVLPKVVLITGIPGAGKTTVSKALAARFERGVAIEGDWLQEIIFAGSVWPDGEPKDEAERQLTLKAENAAMLADRFVEAGFVAVIDDVMPGTHRLGIYLDALRSRPVALVVLAPPVEITLHRDANRGYKLVGDGWTHLDEEIRDQLGDLGLWLDTQNLSVDETVETILSRLNEAILDREATK
jgi:adenylate kinase family enzyme